MLSTQLEKAEKEAKEKKKKEGSDTKADPIPILITLESIIENDEFLLAKREIEVGCVRTMAVSQKKVCLNFPLF